MNTGRITAARSELQEKGYISDDMLDRLSAEEIVFVIATADDEDCCDE